MRLLADLCIARSTIQGLRDDGHDVLALVEAHLNPLDEDVLALAVEQSRVLITEDADFGSHIVREGLPSPGVIRVEQAGRAAQLLSVRRVISLHEQALSGGALVTIRRKRIRIRAPH